MAISKLIAHAWFLLVQMGRLPFPGSASSSEDNKQGCACFLAVTLWCWVVPVSAAVEWVLQAASMARIDILGVFHGPVTDITVELLPVHAGLVLAENKRTVQEFGGFRWYRWCYVVPALFMQNVSCILTWVLSSWLFWALKPWLVLQRLGEVSLHRTSLATAKSGWERAGLN